MNLNLRGLTEDMLSTVNELNNVISVEVSELGEEISVSMLDKKCKNSIEIKRGTRNYIRYKEKHHFFRALGLYVQLSKNGTCTFEKEEKSYIDSVGIMLDISNNAVYKVNTIKRILTCISLMGYKRFMIYGKDNYKVNNNEYFGYLKGKYTIKELKEIDDFAFLLGIEVVPCIDVSAYLQENLKFDYDNKIMNVEKEFEVIESIIYYLRDVFRSNKIHIDINKWLACEEKQHEINKSDINIELITKYLNRINDIVKKYDFKPVIWDDLIYKLLSDNGQYYDTNVEITRELANSIPKEFSLVYWDFYSDDDEHYSKLLRIRENFNNDIIFAGGCWKWTGYVPNYSKTFTTSNAALRQCKKRGIQSVIATAWGSDGSETPINAIILGLILFGEHGYCSSVDNRWLNERCRFLTGLSMNDFTSLEKLDLITTVKNPNILALNPSKYLIYQDILLGAFDKHIEGLNLKLHYDGLSKKYKSIANRTKQYKDMFNMYSSLSKYLAIKSEIGLDIRKAYLENDNEKLKEILEFVLPELKKALRAFHKNMRKLWYKECKGQGFEVIDIRLGGVMERINSTIYRLDKYLENEIDIIEELEEERLYFLNNITNQSKQISFNQYQRIVTKNIL